MMVARPKWWQQRREMCLNLGTGFEGRANKVCLSVGCIRCGKMNTERICPENSDDWVIPLKKMMFKSHAVFQKSPSQYCLLWSSSFCCNPYVLPLYSWSFSFYSVPLCSTCFSSPFTVLCSFFYLSCCLSFMLECKPNNGRDFVLGPGFSPHTYESVQHIVCVQ